MATISKQLRWQRRKVAEGKCRICGKPRERMEATRCNGCAAKSREAIRLTRATSAWKPGDQGRPPKFAEESR